MNLGEQLRQYRKENQLTQKQLADHFFVTDKTISKWENGKGYPDLHTLPSIARLLDTTIDDLLNEKKLPLYYEYKSKREIFGLPLLHIVLPVVNRRRYVFSDLPFIKKIFQKNSIPLARGILAIGPRAKGVLSIGLVAQGLLTLGLLSIGGISVGVAACGVLAIGDLSAGILSTGNIAFGLFVLGNIALGLLTSGNLCSGWTAIGNLSYGPNGYSLGDHYTMEKYQEAVANLHESIGSSLADIFYRTTIWISTHPLFVLGLTLLFVLGIFATLLLVFVKRHSLFFDHQ